MNNIINKLHISNYHYLKNMCREAWAWEFTRRNARYILAWIDHSTRCEKSGSTHYQLRFTKFEMGKAAKFGLLFFIDPSLNAKMIDIFWSPNNIPHILKCSLIEHNHNCHIDGIILADLKLRMICVETFDGLSHLLLKDKCCSIQLLFDEKLDLNTFFDFEIHIPAFCNFPEQLQTANCLSGFLACQKCGRFHSLSATKVNQYMEVLFAYDLIAKGYSQRDAAEIMFGGDAIVDGWDSVGEYIRTRMRRLISRGKKLVSAGFSTFLNSKK